MKYADTGSGLENYDRVRDPFDGEFDCALREEVGTVHALWERPRGLDFIEYGTGKKSACGHPVLVLLPVPFDSEDEGSCAECARRLAARAEDPEGWERRRIDAQQRRRERAEWEEYLTRQDHEDDDEDDELPFMG